MQYFACHEPLVFKGELLFYLVTVVFAQSLSRFALHRVCDTVKEEVGTRSNTSRRNPSHSHKCRIISS
jgi:hypothetical protein